MQDYLYWEKLIEVMIIYKDFYVTWNQNCKQMTY